MTQRRVLQTLAALAPAVLGSMALSVLGLWLCRRLVPVAVLQESSPDVGNYLQVVGTVYAVLLAFVVFVVWQQFNDARAVVEREANDITDLYRTSDGLPDPQRTGLQDKLREYVDAVLGQEWVAMARGHETTVATVGRILDDAWTALHVCQPRTACEETMWADALTRFNELSDARSLRLTSARTRIPLALKLLLYLGAATTIGSIWLLGIDRFAMHAVVTAALTGALAHVLYVIHDLDDAFAGDWQVPREPFLRARDYIEGRRAAVAPVAAA